MDPNFMSLKQQQQQELYKGLKEEDIRENEKDKATTKSSGTNEKSSTTAIPWENQDKQTWKVDQNYPFSK
ncbi:hypothetical protein ABK040_015171 [Willaertia magna]